MATEQQLRQELGTVWAMVDLYRQQLRPVPDRLISMRAYRRRHGLPAIKRKWIPKKEAKEMTVTEYVAIFCKRNGLHNAN